MQTLDIDYMDRKRDFTYDPVSWGDLPGLTQELHNDNIRLTIILVSHCHWSLQYYVLCNNDDDSNYFSEKSAVILGLRADSWKVTIVYH